MPYVDLTTVAALESLEIGIELEADWDPAFGISAIISLGISMSSTMSVELYFDVPSLDFGVDMDPDSVLRIGSEANLFLEAEVDFGLDINDFVISVAQTFLAIFDLGIDCVTDVIFPEIELDELFLTVNIYPVIAFPANYQEYKTRFKIDGTEIPISSFSIKAAPNRIGTDVSVVLSRSSDKPLVVSTSLYSLEIGVVISGVTTWYTLVSGYLTSDSLSIGWDHNAPTDSVSLSHSSGLSKKINISPLVTTIIYDSTDIHLNADDFQTIYDSGGTPYPVLLIPVPGLTLYTVLNIVFSACGLAYSTNIPNFSVKRIDIEIGQSYFQTIGQLFGVYEPIILERAGKVYILDSSMLTIPGSTTPTSITPSVYKSIVINHEVDDINGYVVNYSETKGAWDFYDDVEDTNEAVIIDIDEDKTTIIDTTTFTRNYRRMSVPGVIVRSEIRKIVTETLIIDPVAYDTYNPVIVNRTIEEFTYDFIGKVLTRTKEEFARIPIWYPSVNPASTAGDGFWQYDFRSVRSDIDESTYKSNIFKQGTEYREKFSQTARALIYTDPDKIFETKDEAGVLEIDPDKEVPIDYKQEYVVAYRSGNLSEEGELTYEAIMSRFERVIPLNKDFSRVETKEVDFLTKIVTVNTAEEQVGEIATSSQISVQKRFIVYGYGVTRDNRRLGFLNIGEVPIAYGTALAQRKLQRNNLKLKRLSMEIIGFNPILDRGNLVNVIGRISENLGNYLIEGYSIEGKFLGTSKQTIMTSAEGLLT